MSRASQHRAIAKNERHWSTLAKKEGVSNLQQSRRFQAQGQPILAKNYRQEAQWDFQWSNRRQRIANRNERLAKRGG